jgi:hypothetical protein
MGELTHRKEQLQAQLRQVEEELRGVDAGGTPTKKPAQAAIVASKKPTPAPSPAPKLAKKPATKPAKRASLARLLLEIVSTAGRAMTVKELTQEVVKLKYPTTSTNLQRMIKNRVSALVKKKLLRRADNNRGVLPAQRTAKLQGSATNASSSVPTDGAKQAAIKKPATSTAPAGTKNRLTLPAAVAQVLATRVRPLLARELADKVLASGYQTKSKDFTKNVFTAVGGMATVEHVKGKGYRLKKGKAVK